MRHYNQEVTAEPSISEHNAASIAREQFLKELTSLMASISSKSFTLLSHLVLSPPTSGLMKSQRRWVLVGTIPSARYLRRDDTKPNPLLRPAWADRPPRHLGQLRREPGVLTSCQRTPRRVSKKSKPRSAGREAFSRRAEPAPHPEPAAPARLPCSGCPASRRGPAGTATSSPPPPRRAPRSPWPGRAERPLGWRL